MTKAILIDPVIKEISTIQVEVNDLDELCKVLNCEMFTHIHLGDNQYLLLDDEGLIRDDKDQRGYFTFKNYHQSHLAGRSLIVSLNNALDKYIDYRVNPTFLQSIIIWKDPPTEEEYKILMTPQILTGKQFDEFFNLD